MTIDLGQGRELEAVRDRALAAGAIRAHVLDARDQFARDLRPALAQGRRASRRSVRAWRWRSAGRCIARKLVEIAEIEQADAVAHGAPGRDAHSAPLDVLIRSLNPALQIVAVPSPQPRELAAYARARGLTRRPEQLRRGESLGPFG